MHEDPHARDLNTDVDGPSMEQVHTGGRSVQELLDRCRVCMTAPLGKNDTPWEVTKQEGMTVEKYSDRTVVVLHDGYIVTSEMIQKLHAALIALVDKEEVPSLVLDCKNVSVVTDEAIAVIQSLFLRLKAKKRTLVLSNAVNIRL